MIELTGNNEYHRFATVDEVVIFLVSNTKYKWVVRCSNEQKIEIKDRCKLNYIVFKKVKKFDIN